jgi:hypothetical protein
MKEKCGKSKNYRSGGASYISAYVPNIDYSGPFLCLSICSRFFFFFLLFIFINGRF